MTAEGGFTTVYRSADNNAEEDATAIRNLLVRHGFEAQLCDSSSPGVVTGTYEVRVPADRAAEAEAVVARVDQDDPGRADPSHELDMVTIRRTMGTTGEVEALSIKGILDANGIPAFIVGTSTLPSLSFLVNVPKSEVERATTAIAEAEAAGPAAAVEAEREQEDGA
jgi:hypothetical protein